MRNFLLIPTLLLPLAAAAAAQADEIAGSEFVSGNWSGAAETDQSGAFLDCYAVASFTQGEELWFSLYGDDTLTIFVTQDGVQFQPGEYYTTTMMTEFGYPVTADAYAVDASYAAFTITGVDSAIDYLTQGSYLRFLGLGIDQSFEVRGLGGALAQARSCLITHGTAQVASAKAPSTGATPVLGSGSGGGKPIQMSDSTKLKGKPGTLKREFKP